MEIVSILASALLSGLLGIWISNWYHTRNEKRREKMATFKQLMGNRNELNGQAFTEALNSVFVVFNDSKEVKQAWKEFLIVAMNANRKSEMDQKLLELFKAMSKNLDISTDYLTDNIFLQAFNIKP